MIESLAMASVGERIVRDFAARGMSVAVDEGDLVIEPAHLMTPDMLERARKHKADIVAVLMPRLPASDETPAAVDDDADDPALWVEPERGGFADGFAAAVDELFDVERRIDQGEALIAAERAASRRVPAGWTVRLQTLTTKRLALRKDLTAKYPRALAAIADLLARLNIQEAWCRANADDPAFGRREDVYLANLAAYERLAGAIDRAFATVAAEEADDPARVSWVRAWAELRALGFAEKADVEAAIGGWNSADPLDVVARAKAARQRGVGMVAR